MVGGHSLECVNRAGDPGRQAVDPAAIAELLRRTWSIPPNELTSIVEVAREVLGADAARVLVADYGLLSLQALGDDGPVGEAQSIEGTLAGRALAQGEVVASGTDPTVVYVPLTEGAERVGVLELSHSRWDDDAAALAGPVAQLLVLLLISKRRYTDAVLRSRRSEPLSIGRRDPVGPPPAAGLRSRGRRPERDPRAGLLHRRRLLRLRARPRRRPVRDRRRRRPRHGGGPPVRRGDQRAAQRPTGRSQPLEMPTPRQARSSRRSSATAPT